MDSHRLPLRRWFGLIALLGVAATAAAQTGHRAELPRDPLFARSFLELPVQSPDAGDSAAGETPVGATAKHRLGALRLRSELDERRIEQLWRLKSTNETILDFTVGYRLPGTVLTWELYDPLWYFGPESTWWIVHGPGTVQRSDAAFPEFGRYHLAALFRPPGMLPVELGTRSVLTEPAGARSSPSQDSARDNRRTEATRPGLPPAAATGATDRPSRRVEP